MRRSHSGKLRRRRDGIKWGRGRLAGLDFADDLARISHTHFTLQEMTNNFSGHGEKVGLRIRIGCKTKAMIVGQDQHFPPLTLGERDIEHVQNLTYLGRN